MAITPITGTGGGFDAGNFADELQCKFLSWRATLEGREFNTTGFGDLGWVTGQIINGRVSGDAVGVLTAENEPVPDAVADGGDFGFAEMFVEDVQLTVATGKTWTFDANISAVEIERAEEGPASSVYRIRFASVGAVVQAWA